MMGSWRLMKNLRTGKSERYTFTTGVWETMDVKPFKVAFSVEM
jgi:hypothetical protein